MSYKKLKSFSVLVATTVALALASCSKSDKSSGGEPVIPVTPDQSEAMTPAEQKSYIEKTGTEFINQVPSSDFQSIANLCSYAQDAYGERYDWDAVGEWGSQLFMTAQKALGTTSNETSTRNSGSYTYRYNYFYNDYTAAVMASNFKGHFTASDGRWTYSNANDLQFIFNDNSGKQCVLSLATSGSEKKVHVTNIDEWIDSDYSRNGYNYTYNYYYDRTRLTVGIPEHITVKLTQGGTQLVKVDLNINLSDITNEEFDISKSGLSLDATVDINNGYKCRVSQLKYNANKDVAVNATLSKNGRDIVIIAASSSISGLPSVNIGDFTDDEFEKFGDKIINSEANAKNAFAKVDILGKVQAQGTINDVRSFATYLQQASDNYNNESVFKSALNQANALADINIFYDGKATKQASLKFDAFEDGSWGGNSWWVTMPTINFYDGSSYSTFEDFIESDEINSVINSFDRLISQYTKMFN